MLTISKSLQNSILIYPCFIFTRTILGQLVRTHSLYLEVASLLRTLAVMEATQRMRHLSTSTNWRLEVG